MMARCGTLRSICTEESSSVSAGRADAVERRPSTKPMPPPIEQADQRALRADRHVMEQRAVLALSQNASATALAPAGCAARSARRRAEASQATITADRHEPGRPALRRPAEHDGGRSCATPSAGALPIPWRAACSASLRHVTSLAMVSPNGPGVDRGRRTLLAVRERQQREHQLGEAVGFLQVRIARQDEGVDAEPHVLLHARGHLSRDRRPAPCRRRRAPGRRPPTGWG